LAASALVGLAFAFISALYDFEPSLLLAVFVSTIGIGISQSVAAHFQGQRQFALAMPFTQMQNWLLMPIGIPALRLDRTRVVAYRHTGLVHGGARTADGGPQSAAKDLWSEAISLMTIYVAGGVLLALERLIIPMTIGIENLALFGVVTSLVGWAVPYLVLGSVPHRHPTFAGCRLGGRPASPAASRVSAVRNPVWRRLRSRSGCWLLRLPIGFSAAGTI
jgi:hypothetical protein